MADDLLSLAKRCEKAAEPDRHLDRLCAVASGEYIEGRGRPGMLAKAGEPHIFGFGCPAYTASIDAAMSLIPEEMRDEIEITTLYRAARVTINMNHGTDGGPFYGSNECNSIPLAICAAALKARAVR